MTVGRAEAEIFGEKTTFLSITAFMLAGALALWSGLFYLNADWQFMTVDPAAYHFTRIFLAVFVLMFALHLFFREIVTEGLVILYTAVSCAAFSICALVLGLDGDATTDAIMAPGILLAALMFFHRRNYLLGAATIAFTVAFVLGQLFGSAAGHQATGVCLVAAGVLYIYYACGNLILSETGRNLLRVTQNQVLPPEAPDRDHAYELVAVAGFFVFSTLMIQLGYQFAAVPTPSRSICVAELFLALTAVGFAVYALVRGIVLEGTLMLVFGLSCSIFSAIVLVGYTPSLAVDFFVGVVAVVVGISFVLRGERLLMVGTLLLAAGELTATLLGAFVLGGYAILAGAVCLGYFAVSSWIVLETGRDLLPVH